MCEVPMENLTNTAGATGDLFGNMRLPPRGPVSRPKTPPELTAARVLCRQLRRKHTPKDKQRIAHLICLNLLSMLRHASDNH
jgi:hypothetical protein